MLLLRKQIKLVDECELIYKLSIALRRLLFKNISNFRSTLQTIAAEYHTCCSLSYDRSIASSRASSP